ncbi:MAG: GNAT family N-acetyltransferase [Pseudomonadales bacterium]|nr:GNAT family N-acetyltransferase [Pseudomonadales bacterium]
MTPKYQIRSATSHDLEIMLTILPELADFEIPEKRDAQDLWMGDADLLRVTLAGDAPQSFADVAVDRDDNILGLVLITMRDELMSHAPSAHLEAIVVAPSARGKGLGRALLQHSESSCRQRGAKSLSLHVFSANHRARSLYSSNGFDSELIRAIKWFD